MSFSKIVILFLVSMGIVGCTFNKIPADKHDYFIQFNGEPTDAKMEKVESFILSKNIKTISGFDVIYGGMSYQRAEKIKDLVQERYGFPVDIKKSAQVGNNVFIVVKNVTKDNIQCYTFKLSDFNWYNSSKSDVKKYMGSEICATNINDKNERAK